MSYSPIALFAFNRPIHLKKVLDALFENPESIDSELYIFVDGPKTINENGINDKIKDVVEIVKSEKRFKSLNIEISQENKGLANSIIYGVTKILQIHETIIVLEDDIVPMRGFLNYMNQSLDMYRNTENVGCIHAWNYPIKTKRFQFDTFFLKGTDCWGWATWKGKWKMFEFNASKLYEIIVKKNLVFEFNRRNTINYLEMLQNQIDGKIDSWAIRWDASMLINNQLCLHPIKPIVINIGFDGSGIHKEISSVTQNATNYLNIIKVPITETPIFYEEFRKMNRISVGYRFKNLLKKIIKKFK